MKRKIELKLESVFKTYYTKQGNIKALHDINLEIAEGELVCLLGQSGCGKSTLLQLVAGLEPPTGGYIYAHGEPVTGPSRRRGVVFQNFSLFPWLDVTRNVAFGLQIQAVKDWPVQVKEALHLVGLEGFQRAMPHQLSGGMAQRVALARTLVNKPEVLLMDEPFNSLDAFTRMALQDELIRIWQETQLTTLFVTHDIDEAIYLGNRVIILTPRPGRIMSQVEVPLPHPRDRSHPDLFAIRRQVYAALGLQTNPLGFKQQEIRYESPN